MKLEWRAALAVIVVVAGLIFLMPTMSTKLPSWWTKILPKEKIHLGLDLQGGMHLVLEVEADKAVENTAERLADELKDSLRSQRIAFNGVTRSKGWDIEVNLPSPDQQNDLRQILEKNFPTLRWVNASTKPDGVIVQLTLVDTEVQHVRKLAISQGLETIRNRIDQFGVSEPDIRPQGEDQILVQLPGISDPQRAVSLIGKTALLEFKLVAEGVSTQDNSESRLPAGVKIYPGKPRAARSGSGGSEKYALQDRTLMTGDYIVNASVAIDHQFNTPYVSLELSPQGARRFESITETNVKKQLAIVLDGVVYSAPVIQEKISGGRASITGSFSMEEARDLAIVLRAGALPAPVKVLEERTVGPSLGRDSIHKGLIASLIGGIGIVLFMIIYYKFSGVIANLALIVNVLLVLAGMAAFGATLTLPGIAGLALTIGIAVDANVLIYERIREELRLGKSPRAAVDAGYDRASITILDANLTGLIASAVLFELGTGPIKGFAVTLGIGLIANLYTAIVVTRVIFDYLLTRRRMRELSI